jgi:hypothetical protein
VITLGDVMVSKLRKIGNSPSIIIPADLQEACELGNQVDLCVEGKVTRKGWFDSYKPEDGVDAFASLLIDESSEEWQC